LWLLVILTGSDARRLFGSRTVRLGLVSGPTLTPWSDVFTNVWPLRLAGVSKESPAARRRGAGAGWPAVLKAYPRQLSGGMKMKRSPAPRDAADGPLMDEPSGSG
jgi:ABC-type nitrate/sulfonate/bicarbonate transport system ATPase subunit